MNPSPGEATARRWGPWIVLAASLVLLLPGISELPLLDRDEPRFATATREMLERPDWVIPWFNDQYRFDKPPLIYWMMMPFYALGGAVEWAARLPGVLASAAAALGIFTFGRLFHSARSGLGASLAFLTCLQMQIHGRLALADMPMVAGVLFAFLGAARLLLVPGLSRRAQWGWFWVLWLSLSVSFLAKGPVGLFVLVLALALFRLLAGRGYPWGRLRPLRGLLVFLVPIAAWGLPALVRTDGLYWDVGMGYHVIERGTDAFNERITLPFFYFLSVLLSLFPWMAGLWIAVRRVRREWGRPLTRFLLAWFVSPVILFSFYATQLPHYILPGFPAFFLLLFARPRLPDARGLRTAWQRWYLRVAVVLLGVLGVGGGVLLATAGPGRGLGLAVLGLAGLGTGLLFLRTGIARQAGAPLLAGLVLLLGGSWLFADRMRADHLSRQLAPALAGETPGRAAEGARAYGFQEPSLVFYGGSGIEFGKRIRPEDLPLSTDGPVVVERREYRFDDLLGQWLEKLAGSRETYVPSGEEELPEGAFPPDRWRKETLAGFNPARTSWVEVEVYRPRP